MAYRVPQVSVGGLPQARVSGRDASAGARQGLAQGQAQVGRAVEGLGQSVGGALDLAAQITANEIKKQDNATQQAAYAEASTAKQSLLEDPETGFITRRGHDALKDAKSVTTAFRAQLDAINGRLNERQKEKFRQIYDRELLDFQSHVDRHVRRQSDEVAQQSFTAALNANVNEAASRARLGMVNRPTEHGSEESIAFGVAAIERQGQVMGWDEETTRAAAIEFNTRAGIAVVRELIANNQPGTAKEFLALRRDYMSEEAIRRSGVEGQVNASASRLASIELADRAWNEGEGGDAAGAFAWLDAQGDLDPLVKAGAFRRIDERRRALATAQRERDSAPLTELLLGLEQNRRFGDDDDRFQTLSDDGKRRALRMRRAFDNRTGRNGPTARQRQTLRDEQAKLSWDQMSPDEQASVDVQELADLHDMSPTEMIRLQRRQLKHQQLMATEAGVQMSEFNAQMMARVDQSDVRDKPAMKRHLKAKYTMWRNMNPGKVPTQADVDGWIANKLVSGRRAVDPNSIIPTVIQRQPKMTRAEAEMKGVAFEEPLLEAIPATSPQDTPRGGKAPTVPKADADLIREAFRKRGIDPTDEQIYQAYSRRK